MIRLKTINEMKEWRSSLNPNAKVGFVPTMGALHSGHLSLIQRSQKECDHTIVSIFVNPLQFNNSNDLKNYPRPLERDLEMLIEAQVTLAWTPEERDLYPDGATLAITEKDLAMRLCGEHRPGHFDGVLTIVMKLFQVTRPTLAYFGEKDHQQLALIEKMVKYFFMDVQVVPCPTLRESDGLAMSSRNQLLTPPQRKLAPEIYKVMTHVSSTDEARRALEAKGFKVDYVEDFEKRRYAAAWIGNVRLIDNVEI